MNVIEVKDVEDCFDGTYIKEFLLDISITEKFIKYLGKEGKLQYFPSFSRPFFKIEVEHQYSIKGIEGNNTIRIIFIKNNMDENQKSLIDLIKKYI